MKILVVGGGMAGLCLAPLLASRGHTVTIIEKRAQKSLRSERWRSINLTLTAGGREHLAQLGLLDPVMALGTPLSHRKVHLGSGRSFRQRYGSGDSGWLLSVKRSALHRLLLAAARDAGVCLRFETAFVNHDASRRLATVSSPRGLESVHCDLVIGADGVFSAVRRELVRREALVCVQEVFAWRYVNLDIPASPSAHLIADNRHLHLWAAADCVAVGIPNRDQSVSCVVLFRTQGSSDGGGALARGMEQLRERYPELTALLPRTRARMQTGRFIEVSLHRWWGAGVVVVGDACHAMYPFCGLGLNTALGDVLELSRSLESCQSMEAALRRYEAARRPIADQAQALSRAQFDFLSSLPLRPQPSVE